MKIIPVLDIQHGLAVHARRGDRANYAPLKSRFSADAEPLAVIDGLVTAGGFDVIYIADLDAIRQLGENHQRIGEAAARWPDVRFLVDTGLRIDSDIGQLLKHSNIEIVIASESLAAVNEYAHLRGRVPPERTLLSLDRHGERRFGPAPLFDDVKHWPARVIHMNLAHVGAETGPDFDGLAELVARGIPTQQVYAAGGVRHKADLERLARERVTAVLIGTALHDGRIDTTL